MNDFFSSNSLTKRYSFALSLIAVFTILAYFNLTNILDAQKNDSNIINISGRQRMLSQKIALSTITYKEKELQKALTLMEQAHKKLTSLKMSKEMKKLYFSQPVLLDKRVKEYIKNAKSFIEIKGGIGISYILKHSQPLLRDLDKAVSLYQKEAEQRTQHLKRNELYIMVLTLLTLFLEALFIFRPANKSIQKYMNALKREKEYSDIVTDTNTNAIIAVNEEFKIQTFNKSAQKIFAYTEEEMLGTTLLDDRIIPKKYLKDHIKGLTRFMQSGELMYKDMTFELEGQTKEKKVFPIRVSFGANITKDLKLVVANIQDITEEREKDALLLQQSKLASMGEMIGNIAHQWRQPLSSITTLSSGAKLRYKSNMLSDEELYETFDKINEMTRYLSNTIDDFRNFYKQNKDESEFLLNDIIKRTISLVEATYKENKIKLITAYSKEPLVLKGKESEFSQVLLNILNNAKDAFVENKTEVRVVYIKISKRNEKTLVEIFDSAGGIPESIKDKIFEPYFTTKHKAQGTGIGLFMSNKIITQHFNGALIVENETFSIDEKSYSGAKFTIII